MFYTKYINLNLCFTKCIFAQVNVIPEELKIVCI